MNNKSPMEFFFSLGDKVTKGDPKRKADFDYAMMWIIFLAFGSIFVGKMYEFFFVAQQLATLGWAAFGLAIMWFQYHTLKAMRDMRKMIKNPQPLKIESPEEMLEGFKDEQKDKVSA